MTASGGSMSPAALVFLAGDGAAQRLAVAWPLIARTPDMPEYALVSAWSKASGVSAEKTRRLGPVLRLHGICLDCGTTTRLQSTSLPSGLFRCRLRLKAMNRPRIGPSVRT